MSHDDQGQAGASERRVPISSLVPRRQAAGAESRGINQRFPFWCNKTKTAMTAGRGSSSSPPQRHDQGLFAGEDHFSQDRMYFLSPLKIGLCGIPFCLRSEEEDQGHYKYSLATTEERGREPAE